MANQEQEPSAGMQALIEQIKANPFPFIPTKEELDRVIRLREEADRRLEKFGRVVILGSHE